jgi:hypothetical protein
MLRRACPEAPRDLGPEYREQADTEVRSYQSFSLGIRISPRQCPRDRRSV